jgi:predicted O-methyltransferase YrrM
MTPQLTVTTVECDKRHAEIARVNIERAGLTDRIELVEGLGVDIFGPLREEVLSGSQPRFGLVFIDAGKANNWQYFQLSMGMIVSKSVICVDNVAIR